MYVRVLLCAFNFPVATHSNLTNDEKKIPKSDARLWTPTEEFINSHLYKQKIWKTLSGALKKQTPENVNEF